MSTSLRDRAILGLALLTVGVITTGLVTAQSGTGRNSQSGARQPVVTQPPPTPTSAAAPTRPLQLVDANGRFVAPVLDVDSNKWYARVVFDVEGYVALAEARFDYFYGGPGQGSAVFYESEDCTGTAYIWNPSFAVVPVFPFTAVTPPIPGLQTLHVADQAAAPVSIEVRSERSTECHPQAPFTRDNMRPVVATLDLDNVGEAPFRVVFEPKPPCGAGCVGPPPQ